MIYWIVNRIRYYYKYCKERYPHKSDEPSFCSFFRGWKGARLMIGFFALLLIILTPPVQGAEIFASNYSSIQDAIDSSSDGDTIIVRDGIYSVYLKINRSITLRSENGSANCILEASTNDDVIEVHADWVNITGFTIRNGQDDGIDVEPNPPPWILQIT